MKRKRERDPWEPEPRIWETMNKAQLKLHCADLDKQLRAEANKNIEYNRLLVEWQKLVVKLEQMVRDANAKPAPEYDTSDVLEPNDDTSARKPWWRYPLVWSSVILLLVATNAHAASLKVCYKDVSPDAAKVELFVAGSLGAADLLPGSVSQPDGSTCSTINPLVINAPFIRGTAQQYTLKAANALGEESVASAPLTFRLPQVPTAPTLLSVGAQATP